MKRFLASALAVLIGAAVVMADEPKKVDPPKTEVPKTEVKPDAKAEKKKKKGGVAGKVKSIDAEKGVMVLMVGKKDAAVEKEVKIGDDVKFTIVVSETEKKEGLTAKEGLKSEHLKAGAEVQLTMDGDKVTAVTVGKVKKKKKTDK